MHQIKTIAVIGAGVMGSAIAAHIANAGYSVLLFDIVDKSSNDRRSNTKNAIQKLINNPIKPLMSAKLAKNIEPLNLEDDLTKLNDVDWIIEAIAENIDLKVNLYKNLSKFTKPNCIFSSNTSTIPLGELTKSMDENFCNHFLITHFFNPPRYLELLELVISNKTLVTVKDTIKQFCEINLGKYIVECNDTPGFIANRIGCFFLELGLNLAVKENICIEAVDFILTKYFGIPKTGIFGLWDLIGIDLMPLISKAMVDYLPQTDDFVQTVKLRPEVINVMLAQGLKGKKTKAGFYKQDIDANGKKTELVFDLLEKKYRPINDVKSKFPEFKSIKELFNYPGNIGRFCYKLFVHTLNYAASLVPEATNSINSVDMAMKTGYGWKLGPFELIDNFADNDINGANWLALQAGFENIIPAKILAQVAYKSFYKKDDFISYYDQLTDKYVKPYENEKAIYFSELKKNLTPIQSNNSVVLWDIGDRIACIELANKMGVLDDNVFSLIESVPELIKQYNFQGLLIIGNDDRNFCAGADLNYMLMLIENKDFTKLESFITHGQNAMKTLKNLDIPVVSVVCGVALGGGTELILHSTGAQVYAESKIGLVETKLGLIPGWGGCKQSILNCFYKTDLQPIDQHLIAVFSMILNGYTSNSAIDAVEEGLLLKECTKVTMNKKYLFSDAKNYILELIKNNGFKKNGNGYYESIKIKERLIELGQNYEDKELLNALAMIFTNNGQFNYTEDNLFKLEKDCFINLSKRPIICDKIKMLIPNKKAV